MRIEIIPLIIGALVALLGVGILFDAWKADDNAMSMDRRRRPRVERHRGGEALIGLGVLALAATFVGRDTWRFSTLVSIIGAAFLILGAVLNRKYLRDAFGNRGPLRRRESSLEEQSDRESSTAPRSVRPADEASPRVVERAADTTPADRPAHDADGYSGVERRSRPRGERR